MHAASIWHSPCMYVYVVQRNLSERGGTLNAFLFLNRFPYNVIVYIHMYALTSQHRSPECQIGIRSTSKVQIFRNDFCRFSHSTHPKKISPSHIGSESQVERNCNCCAIRSKRTKNSILYDTGHEDNVNVCLSLSLSLF